MKLDILPDVNPKPSPIIPPETYEWEEDEDYE